MQELCVIKAHNTLCGSIPSLFMRETIVEWLIFMRAAAPLGPATRPFAIFRERTLGLCQEVRERSLHVAAIRRCAGQVRSESRRAVLIIAWDRPDQNKAQAVVPEGPARGTCCRLSRLNDSSDSGESITH